MAWWVPQGRRAFLLKRMPEKSICAEIGVWKGDFSEKILNVVRPRLLHLIDPWKFEASDTYKASWYGGTSGRDQAYMDSVYQSVVKRFEKEIKAGRVVLHRIPSSTAASEFECEYFDWIYIDGNHQFEFVRNDLKSFFPKVKNEGYITGDDYTEGGWWRGGVKKAVDEFVSAGCCSTVMIENNQFILRKSTTSPIQR